MNRPDSSFCVFATFVDSDDALLVATTDGLFRWNNQRWQVLDTHNGLPSNVVYSVLRDDEGALWVRCQEGLVRISDSEFHKWRGQSDSKPVMQAFDRLDGARPGAGPTIQPSDTRTADGRLWFVAGTVVQMIDPKQTFQNQIPPPVYVEKVVADHKEYGLAKGIELPALTRDVQIDYTALSVTAPQKVFFRYQLEGHDGGWQEAGTRRQAFYNDLPPGNYRFRVTACNNSGVRNEAGASFDFSIARAYYQTAWFRALCVATFVTILLAAHRLRVHVLERRQAALEEHQAEIRALNERLTKAQEAERMRISGELHDGVLQQITSLSCKLGTAKHQAALGSEAKATIRGLQQELIEIGTEVRHLSHELHPALLKEAGLPAALSAYCEEFSQVRGLPVSCDTDETVKELSPEAALGIYRIAQEILGNAAKYAAAKKVEVRLTRSDGCVILSVSDDGVGYDPQRVGKSGGLGLINMRERVLQLNGTFELDSEPGRGTTVRVEIPFRAA